MSSRADRCPFPEKYKHANRGAALKALRKLDEAGKGSPDMSAYPCGDHWHVGHDARLFAKRIRKALAGAPRPRRRG